jgi:hypothetical protein
MRGYAALLYCRYLAARASRRLSQEAKFIFFWPFTRRMRTLSAAKGVVMRSTDFLEGRRRIKLSQWTTVHADRG